MSPQPRSVLVRGLVAAAGSVLALGLLPAASPSLAAEPGPIHAGNTYGWYRSKLTRWEFQGSTGCCWKTSGGGNVQEQHGMLTLNTGTSGNTSALLAKAGHRTGRWEIRLRAKRYETAFTNYRVMTELVPAGTRDQHCGGQNIALENFALGRNVAKIYAHNLPDRTYRGFKRMNLANDRWHTFAVEVTRRRISWFIDAHVYRTERRAGAISGVPLTVRFTMKAKPGARMNQSRMQMDWLRYWTTDTPNKLSVRAPRMELAKFPQAC